MGTTWTPEKPIVWRDYETYPPINTFLDPDGDAMTYSAKESGTNTSLNSPTTAHAWMTFDITTGKFSGKPPKGHTGNLVVILTANDGLEDSDDLTVTFTIDTDVMPACTPPADMVVLANEVWTYQLPYDTCIDPDALDKGVLTYAVTSTLPTWATTALTYTAATRTFTGEPLDSTAVRPFDNDVGETTITMTVDDQRADAA